MAHACTFSVHAHADGASNSACAQAVHPRVPRSPNWNAYCYQEVLQQNTRTFWEQYRWMPIKPGPTRSSSCSAGS
jgi:hypothetical protein